MRDIGEGAAMNQRRIVFQRLDKVRLQASRSRTVIAPSAPISPCAVTGALSKVSAMTMRPSRSCKSARSRARHRIAITSRATVMSKPLSRG